MDPSAQVPANQANSKAPPSNTVPSSQLGGGANGDNSKINGDQIIQNPLSNQVIAQKQEELANQIVARNMAQVMNNAQVPAPQKPAQQASPSQAQVPQPVAAQPKQASVQQANQTPVQQSAPQQASQVSAQSTPVQSAPAQPGTMQSPAMQQNMQPVQNQQPIVQQTTQPVPSQQVVQQQVPQQQVGQPNQAPAQPGTMQNPVSQQNMQQVVTPQSNQQMIPQQVSQQQPVQQVQNQQPIVQQTTQPVPSQQVVVQQSPMQVPVQQVQPQQQVMQQTVQQVPQQQVVQQQNPQVAVQQPGIVQTAPQPVVQDPNQQQAQGIQTSNLIVNPGERDQIQDLENIVANAPIPEELKVIIKERIDRLKLIKAGSGYMSNMYIIEYEATSRYINWCAGLPWTTKTQDTLDLSKAKEILDRHHYGLNMLKNRMLEFIASIMLNLQNNGPDFASRSPILCFVGLAGTGKTTFAISMAEALNRQFERIPFGGMSDSRVLRGQSRFFPDAEPGQFIKRLSHAKSKNPVILLDEIDRVTETARADIMGVLIEALDPEQNSQFTDHYIDYPFSLSNCLFVATSNNISTIATAVLDRMEIIQMPNYNDDEKKVIGRDYVFPKVRKLMGLKDDQLIIDEAVWDAIIRPLGYDPGVRALDRIIGMIARRAARLIVSGEAQNVRVTMDNMKPFVQDF